MPMRLIRNTTTDGTCKYALLRLDKMRKDGVNVSPEELKERLGDLAKYLEIGEPCTSEEFFVIKLKDIHSKPALRAYGIAAINNGFGDLGDEVLDLAERAGGSNQYCHNPDNLL